MSPRESACGARCCPKGPVCRGSAPRTAGASEDSQAPEAGSSRAAASGAGPASDREGGTVGGARGGAGPVRTRWGAGPRGAGGGARARAPFLRAGAVEALSEVSAGQKGGCGFECGRGGSGVHSCAPPDSLRGAPARATDRAWSRAPWVGVGLEVEVGLGAVGGRCPSPLGAAEGTG